MSDNLFKPTTPPTATVPPTSQQKEGVSENGVHLPLPVAKYEEVVANPELFMDTLVSLQKATGTKTMIPTMGGKALDLHRLFVEVTSRGGLEQVIRDRKWREVIAVFNFPSTITNASFVLRKYYMSLLHEYEQVYFFRSQDQPVSASDSLPLANTVNASAAVQSTTLTQEKDATGNKLTMVSTSLVGGSVSGVIDGKFDGGYLVSVNIGSNKLKGVLYHVPIELPLSPSPAPAPVVVHRRSRKRNRRALKDPSRPKSNRSGYNFFFQEHYARLKPLHYREEHTISKKIGVLWGKLTDAEREVYQQKAAKDKERYQSELKEYRKSSIP